MLIRFGQCHWHQKKKKIQIFVYRAAQETTEKNFIIVNSEPTDVHGASATRTENYAKTSLPGQQFNFQKQNLALRY
jgi:hypothetical protein